MTQISQIRNLSTKEAAAKPAVELEAVVTHTDLSAGMLFISDSSGGIFLSAGKFQESVRFGVSLRIKGHCEPGSRLPFVIAKEIEVRGQAPLLTPRRTSPERLLSGTDDAEWVELRGVVRATEPELVLATGNHRVKLWVASQGAIPGANYLPGMEVRVWGVGGLETEADRVVAPALFVSQPSLVKVEKDVPADLFTLPGTSLDKLPGATPSSAIRIAGRFSGTTADGLDVVRDGGLLARIRTLQRVPLHEGDWVEATGFLSWQGTVPLLEDAVVRIMTSRANDSTLSPMIASAREIRNLTPQEAAKAWPTRLRATITYVNPIDRTLFVHDGDAGIFVGTVVDLSKFKAGELLELEGATGPGGFAPILQASNLVFLGPGRIPPPKRLRADALVGGQEDSQWIELDAVVQAIFREPLQLRFVLSSGDRICDAILRDRGTSTLPKDLVDARVRVRGVCISLQNERRQFLAAQLVLGSLDQIETTEKPPEDPFSLPIQSASELLRFGTMAGASHRVHLRGVVTGQQPLATPAGGRLSYLQDVSGPVAVETIGGESLQPGMTVDVAGFPKLGQEPRLTHAVVRVAPGGAKIVPKRITPSEAWSGNHPAELVSIQGDLIEAQQQADSALLRLRTDGHTFEARLYGKSDAPWLASLRPESTLQLTGVNQVDWSAGGSPTGFRLLLREKQDVEVLQAPPWWTEERLTLALAITLGLIFLAAIWGLTLRRKVTQQTEVIRTRLEHEAKLEARIQRLVESHLLGIVFWEQGGRIQHANQEFLNLAGLSKEDLAERKIGLVDLLQNDSVASMEKALIDLRETGKCAPFEAQLRRPGKASLPVMIGAALLEVKPESGVSFVLNMSEQVQLAQQLRQAQKMETVGRLAGGVAHDFNNILTVIQGHCGLLLAARGLQEEDQESLREINVSAERASNLTRQLLMFSRKQVIQPRALDLNEIVAQLTKMLTRILGEDVTLQCSYGPALPLVRADSGMMEQILMNLAVNARDAMPKGGQLQIKTSTARIQAADIPRQFGAKPGVFVCLSVQDTGCGMTDEVMNHLFEPFFTTKEVGKGTGLGLATIFGIVETHNGFIKVKSQFGYGTTFDVFLPANAETIDPGISRIEPADSRGGSETILLVEDEAPVRQFASKALAKCGYRIIEAANGVDALGAWKKNRGQIDLLLTDIVMPKGVTGRELARMLQQEDADLKVIYSSGYSLDLVKENQDLVEGLNFLPKPYDPARLARTIRARLDA